MQHQRINGFTLLELLVALAIFAVLAAMTYAGLNQMRLNQQINQQHSEFSQNLQALYATIHQDINFIIQRDARDAYGETQKSIRTDPNGEFLVEFSNAGRTLVLEKQTPLQRIRYQLIDNDLVRSTLSPIDSAPNPKEHKRIIAQGVDLIEIEFAGTNQQWGKYWPPLQQEKYSPPVAVRFTIGFVTQGELEWLFAL